MRRSGVSQGLHPHLDLLSGERAWRRILAYCLVGLIPFGYLLIFTIWPLGQQAVISLFHSQVGQPSVYVGLRNYRVLFGDPQANAAWVHTAVYVVLTVPSELVLGLAGAWLVVGLRRGSFVITALYILPLVIPWTSAASLFLGLFNSDGVLNSLRIDLLGGHGQVYWLDNPTVAFALIVLAGIWKGAPWCFLLLTAALQSCGSEVFEAAEVDGARRLSLVRRVIVPSILPMFIFVTVFRIFAEAQNYTSVALLTGGGPVGATELAANYANGLAFGSFNFGEASAMGTVAGAGLLVVAAIGFYRMYAVQRRSDRPEGLWRFRRRGSIELARWAGTPLAQIDRSQPPLGVLAPVGSPASPVRRIRASSIKSRHRRQLVLIAILAVIALIPLLGGLPGGGWRLDFALPWSAVGKASLNSLVLTVGTLVGTFVLAVPAAYLLATGRSRLRSVLFVAVLLGMAIPGAMVVLPQYQEISWLRLVNNLLGVAIVYIGTNLPLAIFFLRAAFAAVPKAYSESMHIDGASTMRIVTRLFLPVSLSTVVTVSVFVIIQVWNELLLAAVILNNPDLFPLPVLVALGTGGIGSLGASWLLVLPPLLVFLACQRTFQRGMRRGLLA